ncbi:hypothetical protein Poly30_17570 [Planctomycetes bacterium Poly30]|uniref:HEAT repeat protein n=2 Tax=Saltatorellus ferox TaxID=2528018 RepID=A0A518EQ88_9BACT|nr:hypothetical protein Poly30_17570 [Planctomycetes bacterium Poly30]
MPDGPGGPRLAKLLLDASRGEYSVDRIRDAAAAFGSASIPAVLDVLEEGTFHERRKQGGIVVHALDEDARLGLARALGTFQWESVRRWIEHRLQGDPSLKARSTLLFVVGAAAPDESLGDLLMPIADVPRGQERALRQPLEDALASALARESNLQDELRALFVNTPPTFLRSVIAGIKKGGDQASLDGLSRLLDSVPEADPLLMIEISDLAKTVVRPVPGRTLDRIRAALISRNESVQVEAAKALGRLDDVAAVPMLIEALLSTSGALRIEAKVALDRLSAERFGSDAAAWSQWHSDSQRWLQGEAPRWKADLRTGDQSRVSRALLQVARFRIYRYEFVEDVAAALANGNENTCVVACAVLGHFATSGSIEPLLKALDHPIIAVRKAALEALVRATGADHGEHASEWRAAGWPRT